MIGIALALWFQPSPHTLPRTLIEEVYTIPAADWRYVPLVLRQQPAAIVCEFRVLSGGAAVRVSLVDPEGLAAWRRGSQGRTLASAPASGRGQFRYAVTEPGEYAVILDNTSGGPAPARVRLRASLDFSGREPLPVRLLEPRRRAAVVAISLAVFLAIATYSGRRLWNAVRR